MNDYCGDYISLARHKNVSCRAHLHPNFEIVCVNKGTVKMTVNGNVRTIKEGQATVIMPIERHSFDKSDEESECMVIVFGNNCIQSFYKSVRNQIPKNPVCTLDAAVFSYIASVFPQDENYSFLKAQAILYPLCEQIYHKCGFLPAEISCESVFLLMTDYTSEHFSEITSLSDIAGQLKFNSAYLSRVFKQNSGYDYTYYLNSLKCSHAARLLIRNYPEMNITQIAYSSGFGSIRSFNRVFYEVFNTTPKEYMKQKRLFSL